MRTVIILSLLLAAVACESGKRHACVHDTKFKGLTLQVMEEMSAEEHKRVLQIDPGTGLTGGTTSGSTSGTGESNVKDGWHQMRIYIDYSYSNRLINKTPSLTSKYEMSIRLVESVRAYFNKLLQVNFTPYMNFRGGECYSNKVPAFNSPIDLFITIYPENDSSTDYFAAATPCYLSARDNRPTVGAYILNMAYLKTAPINEYLYFSTFAHEFTHILGFSNDLFERYVDSSGRRRTLSEVVTQIRIGSETFNAIKLPEVINYARTYFNCPSIQGVPLENNGGDGSAGSHWEKTFMPQEYMNPTVENPGILSMFTYALLQGTGWYQVDTSGAQNYDWGQNAGCGIFNICPAGSINGYCSAGQVSQSVCSSEWTSKVREKNNLRQLVSKIELSHQDAT